MPSNPDVQVKDITDERSMLVNADKPSTPDLGGRHSAQAAALEANLGEIMGATRQSQSRVFELTWTGGRVPRGANVLGHTIGWTQHGFVTTTEGVQVGTYERVVDGVDGVNKMLVFIEPPALTDVAGNELK